MKCVVFGGTGFLGTHTCKALLARGYEVVVYARNVEKFQSPNTKVIYCKGDFTQEQDFGFVVEQADIVIHAISTTNVSNQDCVLDVQNNVVSTIRLLEACVKFKVKKFIFFSSGGTIYGKAETVPIKEETILRPVSSYGMQKAIIEKYMEFYSKKGLKSISLRFANPYGCGQNAFGNQGVVAVFLAKVLLRQTIQIWGDSHIIRDFVYIDDAVEAVLAAIDYSGSQNTFNIGSGVGVSLEDVVNEIRKVTGKHVNVEYLDGRNADVSVNILDISKVKKELKWSPSIDFSEGVEKLYHSWDHKKRCFSF